MARMLQELKYKKIDDFNAVITEHSASEHINIISHLDDTTLIDKNNQLIRIFGLDGISATTLSDENLSYLRDARNQFFKDLDVNIAFYFWSIRKRCKVNLGDGFKSLSFCETFNQQYQEKLNQSNFFETEHYLVLVAKSSDDGKSFKKILNTANEEAFNNFISQQMITLNDASKRLCTNFNNYIIRTLGIVKRNNKAISEPLSVVDYILNHKHFDVPRMPIGADKVLMRQRPFFNKMKGIITLLDINNTVKYAAILSIKTYCSIPFAGMLDDLQQLAVDLVVTQSFAPLYRDTARKKLNRIQKKMLQSPDESIVQTKELSQSIENLASSESKLGIHHFTVCVYADTEDELDDNITRIREKADAASLVLIREYLGLEIGFWAQLPGNFNYIARGANITTKNLAAFTSFHNQAKGRATNNHWGNALTILQTGFSSPFHFNIHARDVGIGLIYGAQGAGKTVLVGSIILQSMKFGGRRVILDKKQGLKAMVLATRGAYFDLKANVPSGFNPLQLCDTPTNRDFLINLLQKMLTIYGNTIDETSSKKIKTVVDNIYSNLQQNERVMRNVAPLFGAPGKSELRGKFDEWHTNGRYAWVFDNERDNLTLDRDIIGFDIEQIISLEQIKTPIFMYLLHKAEEALHGMRGGIAIEEGWVVLSDEYLKKRFIEDAAHDTRKKDNFLLLSTQEVENVVKNKDIAASLNNSQSFSIFYPNREASKETYCETLSLTNDELRHIKDMTPNGRYFLLKHKDNNTSEIVRLNLSGMDDMLNLISGSEAKSKILDEVLANFDKDNVDAWLPVYMKKIAEIKH